MKRLYPPDGRKASLLSVIMLTVQWLLVKYTVVLLRGFVARGAAAAAAVVVLTVVGERFAMALK